MKKVAYRPRPNNSTELLELIAGTSMTTGRVFRLANENENLTLKEVIKIKDSLTGQMKTYVFSHIE
jgi:hypothetical protein